MTFHGDDGNDRRGQGHSAAVDEAGANDGDGIHGQHTMSPQTPEKLQSSEEGHVYVLDENDHYDVQLDLDGRVEEIGHASSNLLQASPDKRAQGDGFDQKPKVTERIPIFGKWSVLAAVFVNFGLSIGLPVSIATIFLEWQDTFQTSRAQAVAVPSIAVGILFAAALIPGYLMDRFGARFVVVVGSGMCSMGLFLSLFAVDIHFLIVTGGIVSGMGFCMVQLPTFPCLTMCFTRYKTQVMALCSIGSGLANALLPYLNNYLVFQYSWRGAFAILSGIALQMLPCGLVMTSFQTSPKSNKSSGSSQSIHITQLCSENDTAPENASLIQVKSQEFSATPDVVKPSPICQRNFTDTKVISHAQVEVVYDDEDNTKTQNDSSIVSKMKLKLECVKLSKWKFMLDPLFVIFLVHVSLGSATLVSFMLVIVDFSKTIGYEDPKTGLFFILIVTIFTFVGRAIVSGLSLIPHVGCYEIYCGIALVANGCIFLLSVVSGYTALLCMFAVIGIGIGSLVVMIPRCPLGVDSVTLESYPLAYSLACTMEGIFDCIIPIFIGYTVDKTGSYDLPLQLVGGLGVTISVVLAIVQWWTKSRRQNDHALNNHHSDVKHENGHKEIDNNVGNKPKL